MAKIDNPKYLARIMGKTAKPQARNSRVSKQDVHALERATAIRPELHEFLSAAITARKIAQRDRMALEESLIRH